MIVHSTDPVILSGNIKGLLRACAPVKHEFSSSTGVVSRVDDDLALVTWDAGTSSWPRHDRLLLDLPEPMGRCVALLYLYERGLRPDWMRAINEGGNQRSAHASFLLGVSVLRVSRGLEPLRGQLGAWDPAWNCRWSDAGSLRSEAVCRLLENEAGEPIGWDAFRISTKKGPEIGDEGKACADREALAKGFALLSEDGTLSAEDGS